LKKQKLIKILLKRLKDYPSLSWEAQEVLEFCELNINETIDFIDYRLKKEKATMHNRSEFEAIPHEGIKYLEKSINSFEDYYKFIKKFIVWDNTKLFFTDIGVKDLFEPIEDKKEKDSVDTYLVKSIKELIKENLLIDAIICAEVLPLSIETVNLFLEISQKGVSANLYNEVHDLLFYKTRPRDIVYSSPEIFIQIEDIFKQMLNKTEPGKLNNLLSKCIDTIKERIKDNSERNEEYGI
jgi:hypothetical protein